MLFTMVLGHALRFAAAASMLAGCGVIDSDGDAGGNHAPVVDPASVTLREDLGETLTIHGEDVDGDDLEMTMYLGFGGTYDLETLTHTTVNGISALDAKVRVRGWPDFYGEGDLNVWISDGVERASATITVTITPVNDKPTARDNAFATASGTELVISGSTLLANDDDAADVLDDDEPQNRGLTIASVGSATHGAVSYVDGKVRFAPEPGFVGTAPFTYRISDGEDTALATVRVLVGGNNASPIVVEDKQETMEGVAVNIDVDRLLSNDVDDDGHTLAVVGVGNPEHGTVELTDRTIKFTPKGDNGGTFFGTAGFEYTITDGAATSTGHVIVEVAPWIF
jgi:large repetitive protein